MKRKFLSLMLVFVLLVTAAVSMVTVFASDGSDMTDGTEDTGETVPPDDSVDDPVLPENPFVSVKAEDSDDNEAVIESSWDGPLYCYASLSTSEKNGTLTVGLRSGCSVATPGAIEVDNDYYDADFFVASSDNPLVFSYNNLSNSGYVEISDFWIVDSEGNSIHSVLRITLNFENKWREQLVVTDPSGNNLTPDSTGETGTGWNLIFSSQTSLSSGTIHLSAVKGYTITSVIAEYVPEETAPGDTGGDSAVAQLSLDSTNVSFDSSSADIAYTGLSGTGTINIAAEMSKNSETMSVNMLVDLTYQEPVTPPSDSGGGGGGSDDPPAEIINVINEDNPENLSNDTILTSNHTTEKGDTSTTKVSSAEADALIDLAEQHAEDIQIEEGDHEAVINVESQGAEGIDTYVVVIAAKDEQKIEESIIDVLSIATPAGDFRIRTEELAEQTDSKPAEFKVTLTRAEHEGRAAVEVKLELAKENIQQFEEQYNVEIRIPYTPAEDEDVNGLIIEYVATDGETFTITESHYDADKGMLCFFAPHLSKYGVAYNPKFFSDVKTTHWASGYITFLASRGIISGMGNGKFQPDAKVTKAQFITMMTNAFSKANIGQKAIKSYKDVKTTDWFAKQMGWSYINNLSNVLAKNGYIYPNANLTREDMATLSNNISLGLSLRLKNTGASTTFSDAGSISGYAVSGVQRMVACGILNGAGGKFFPKNGLTRAEAAKVISVLISSMK